MKKAKVIINGKEEEICIEDDKNSYDYNSVEDIPKDEDTIKIDIDEIQKKLSESGDNNDGTN